MNALPHDNQKLRIGASASVNLLVSTSANVSGEPSPANFSEVSEVIKEGVDYIVSYRQDDMSKAAPSGIIKLGAGGLVQVIR